MKMYRYVVIGFFLFSLSVPGYAGPGTTAVNSMKISLGARPVGMGEAFAGVADDINAMWWNPAGLSQIKGREISLTYNSWILDIYRGHVAYCQNLKDLFVFGAGAAFFDGGSIPRTIEDGGGNYDGTGASFRYSDAVITLSVAKKLTDIQALGANLNVIMSTIDNQSANAFAADIGYLYKMSPLLTLGADIQNLGGAVQYSGSSASDPLPLNFRIGAGYRFKEDLLFSADINVPIDNIPNLHLGTEYSIGSMFRLRAGYKTDAIFNTDLLSGLCAGIGIAIDDLDIDYAFTPYADLGCVHRISLLYRLGGRVGAATGEVSAKQAGDEKGSEEDVDDGEGSSKVVYRAPAPKSIAEKNILKNSGFEEEDVLNGWAQYWDKNRVSIDTKQAKEGRVSLSLGAATTGSAMLRQTVRDFQAGDKYIASVWIKTEDLRYGRGSYLSLSCWSGDKMIDFKVCGDMVQGTQDWVQRSDSIIIPAGTDELRFEIASDGAGKSWFDEAVLIKEQMSANLVLHYSFDNDAKKSVTDGSDQKNDGKPKRVEYAEGKKGQALNLSGIGYVRIPLQPSLNPAGKGWTVMMWVKTAERDCVVLADGDDKGGYAFYMERGLLKFALRNKSNLDVVHTRLKPAEDWHHVTGVITENGWLKLYVNAELVKEREDVGLIAEEPTEGMEIGIDRKGFVGKYNKDSLFYKGMIDELRIYDGELKDYEIKKIYMEDSGVE